MKTTLRFVLLAGFILCGSSGCDPQVPSDSTPLVATESASPTGKLSKTESHPSRTVTLQPSPSAAPTGMPTQTEPAVTPTGPQMENRYPSALIAFYDAGRINPGLYLLNPNEKEPYKIYDGEGGDLSLSWAPDGHWLVFDDAYSRYQSELYKIRTDGEKLTQLTQYSGVDMEPSWAPDGKHIAYLVQDSKGFTDMVIKDIEKNQKWQLTYTDEIEKYPVWSPDGSLIAFYSIETLSEHDNGLLQVMDAEGKNKRVVTSEVDVAGPLSWSPDGKQLAFTSFGDKHYYCGEIYVVNLDGSNLRQLTDLPGCAMEPSWSPDGEYIAFVASDETCCNIDAGWNIYVMKADGSDLQKFPSRRGWAPFALAWSPVPSLKINQTYTLTDLGDHLNLRAEPSLDAEILARLRTGQSVTVLDGPVDADHYYWFRLETADGQQGWAVEAAGWYQLAEE